MLIGNACRNKVLRKKITSPEVAKAHYFPLQLCASEPEATGLVVSVSPDMLCSELTPKQQLQELSKSYCTSYTSVYSPTR